MSLPCQGNKPPAGKAHVKMSLRRKEHLHTAAHHCTRKRIETLYGNEACQTSTHVAPGASVEGI